LIASIPELVPAEIVAASREAERARLARLRQQREERRHPLGDWPLVVLTRGVDENPELAAVHSALARLSTNSRHTVVAGAGHEIQLFQPAVVVQAIHDVVESMATARPLPLR
jgi:pimeloyl-ACP methyl ester carboxylesterase